MTCFWPMLSQVPTKLPAASILRRVLSFFASAAKAFTCCDNVSREKPSNHHFRHHKQHGGKNKRNPRRPKMIAQVQQKPIIPPAIANPCIARVFIKMTVVVVVKVVVNEVVVIVVVIVFVDDVVVIVVEDDEVVVIVVVVAVVVFPKAKRRHLFLASPTMSSGSAHVLQICRTADRKSASTKFESAKDDQTEACGVDEHLGRSRSPSEALWGCALTYIPNFTMLMQNGRAIVEGGCTQSSELSRSGPKAQNPAEASHTCNAPPRMLG
mmetsp:Transcript_165429/g.530806  ORF Transcript_165429/g.530806 Transcript_165429/m.530806 type:complete len:267 (+) Transcript_165429:590-1390(+)